MVCLVYACELFLSRRYNITLIDAFFILFLVPPLFRWVRRRKLPIDIIKGRPFSRIDAYYKLC